MSRDDLERDDTAEMAGWGADHAVECPACGEIVPFLEDGGLCTTCTAEQDAGLDDYHE